MCMKTNYLYIFYFFFIFIILKYNWIYIYILLKYFYMYSLFSNIFLFYNVFKYEKSLKILVLPSFKDIK